MNDDFEDRILSCKIQLLHHLPSVTFDCVEEDSSLSSKDRTRQDFVLMAQCQSIFYHVLVWLLLYQRVLLVVVLLLPFDLAATTLMLVCGTRSSCGSAGICVVLN